MVKTRKVKIYVEGGGDSQSLKSRCREGFSTFLKRAGFKGRMPKIVACGCRQSAFNDFKTALNNKNETALLLLDSEDPVSSDSPWEHLASRESDNISKPANAHDDQCHLMVVCMESWFLADKEALKEYFGQGFHINSLPANPAIESVSKKGLYDGIKKATAHCKTKAAYDKGSHSFQILCIIDPQKVRKASPWADRFLKTIDTRL